MREARHLQAVSVLRGWGGDLAGNGGRAVAHAVTGGIAPIEVISPRLTLSRSCFKEGLRCTAEAGTQARLWQVPACHPPISVLKFRAKGHTSGVLA